MVLKWYEDVCVSVYVCACMHACANRLTWSMRYVGISTYQFIPCYASAIYMHTRILKPFEDSEPTGLKVDIVETHWSPA